MRAARAITAVELRRVVRDRTGLFFVLVLPIIITLVLGVTVFGSIGGDVTVGYLDLDGSEAAGELGEQLDGGEGVDVRTYDDRDELLRHVRQRRVGAAVLVPAGYGDGRGAVELVAVPGADAAAVVRPALRAALAADARQWALAAVVDRFGLEVEAAGAAADSVLAENPPPDVVVSTARGEDSARDVNQFTYTSVSNLVLFVFINTVAGGAALVETRRLGVARRMLAGPVTTSAIVAGTLVSRLVFAVLQSVLLLGVGVVVFGVDFGDPIGGALLVVAFSMVSAAAGVLLGSVFGSAEQAAAVAVPVSIAMGMLGGTMWPLSIVGDAMRTAGHLTPHAWAMDGWLELAFDGRSVGSVVDELAVLAAFAVVLGTIATRRLRRALVG